MVRSLSTRGERPLTGQFAELAQILADSAVTHSRILGQGPQARTRLVPILHENSSRATEISARIATRLADSLITPYEAELLYDLALTMADCIDSLEHTGELLVITRLSALSTPLLEAAEALEHAAEYTVQASWQLRRVHHLGGYYTRMRTVKHQGDRLCRQALGELYRAGGAATDMMLQRDVIYAVSTTFELLERVARIADMLRVKDS